jgi:hypothetical protein
MFGNGILHSDAERVNPTVMKLHNKAILTQKLTKRKGLFV